MLRYKKERDTRSSLPKQAVCTNEGREERDRDTNPSRGVQFAGPVKGQWRKLLSVRTVLLPPLLKG